MKDLYDLTEDEVFTEAHAIRRGAFRLQDEGQISSGECTELIRASNAMVDAWFWARYAAPTWLVMEARLMLLEWHDEAGLTRAYGDPTINFS